LKIILEQIGRKNSEIAHTDAITGQDKVIGVNIVDKMLEQFIDDTNLSNYILNLVRSAQTFMKYDNNEFSNGIPPQSVMAILLPQAVNNQEFREELAELFLNSQISGMSAHIIDTNHKNNEITLISFKYAFPLRFLQPVHYLKRQFDYRLSQGEKERAILEIFTQEHNPPLPSLLRPLVGEAGDKILPLLQIAQVLNLFSRVKNPSSGKFERVLEVLDKDGIPTNYIYDDALLYIFEEQVSTSIPEVKLFKTLLRQITHVQLEILEDKIDSEFIKESFKVASNRDILIEKLTAQIAIVKKNRGNNIYDIIYKEVIESTRIAIKKVRTIVFN